MASVNAFASTLELDAVKVWSSSSIRPDGSSKNPVAPGRSFHPNPKNAIQSFHADNFVVLNDRSSSSSLLLPSAAAISRANSLAVLLIKEDVPLLSACETHHAYARSKTASGSSGAKPQRCE